MTMTASPLYHYEEEGYEYGSCRILLCGKAFTADKTGALYWPAERTLTIADLHLEKGSYLTEEEVMLPPYDTTSSFDKLEEAIDRYDPERVIALGDSFCGKGELDIHDLDWLLDLMEGREWFWIKGPESPPVPPGIGGTVAPHVTLSGIKFRHEPVKAPVSNEIAGSMHPAAIMADHDYHVHGRCFVSNGMRLLLPSVGIYTRGANVMDETFDPFMGRNGLFVWVLANDRVQQVAAGQLVAG